MGTLEGGLLNDPNKALQLPLLSKDLADFKLSQQSATDGVRKDVDRVYDITKLTVGALAIGVLAQAAGNFFTRRTEEQT